MNAEEKPKDDLDFEPEAAGDHEVEFNTHFHTCRLVLPKKTWLNLFQNEAANCNIYFQDEDMARGDGEEQVPGSSGDAAIQQEEATSSQETIQHLR